MHLLALCLVVCLSSSVYGQDCAQLSITLDQKLDLIIEDNDDNKDGKVTYEDVYSDIDKHFDHDNDGIVTETDMVTRFMCRYAMTRYMSTFMSNDITGGLESVHKSDFKVPPFNTTGFTFVDFKQRQRDRFERFRTQSCVDRHLTLEEKLQLIVSNSDNDNNGMVDPSDITATLTRYDTDNNQRVTLWEFVLGWICDYGDDGYFARHMWSSFVGEASDIATQAAPQPSMTIAALKAHDKKIYEDYAKAQQASDSTCSNEGRVGSAGSLLLVAGGCLLCLARFTALTGGH